MGNIELGSVFTPAKIVYSPKIEFMEVKDARLKKNWPNGISRIVFELKNPKNKGKIEFVMSEVKWFCVEIFRLWRNGYY